MVEHLAVDRTSSSFSVPSRLRMALPYHTPNKCERERERDTGCRPLEEHAPREAQEIFRDSLGYCLTTTKPPQVQRLSKTKSFTSLSFLSVKSEIYNSNINRSLTFRTGCTNFILIYPNNSLREVPLPKTQWVVQRHGPGQQLHSRPPQVTPAEEGLNRLLLGPSGVFREQRLTCCAPNRRTQGEAARAGGMLERV